jgi:hypothetical protein
MDTKVARKQITNLKTQIREQYLARFKPGTKVKVKVRWFDLVERRHMSDIVKGVIVCPPGLWGKNTVEVFIPELTGRESLRDHATQKPIALASFSELDKLNPV